MEYLEKQLGQIDGITNNHYMSDLVGICRCVGFLTTMRKAPAAEFEHEEKSRYLPTELIMTKLNQLKATID